MSRFLLSLLLLFASPLFAQIQGDPNITTVHGTVVSSDSTPISQALVEFRSVRSGTVSGRVYTNPDGSFQITGLKAGEYILTIEQGTNAVEQEVSVTESQPDLKITIPGGAGAQSARNGSPTVSVSNLNIPAKARRALEAAEQYLYKKKFAQAASELERALKLAPRFADAFSLRAVLHLATGQPKLAVQDASQSIKIDPTNYMGYTVLGAAYNVSGDFQMAANSLHEALKLDPAFWQSHFEMAKSLYGQRKAASALAEIDQAAQSAPKSFSQIHLVRGAILLELHKSAEAATEFQQFLKLDPKGPDADKAEQALANISRSPAENASSAQK